MTILLLGTGPRLAWVHSVLEAIRASSDTLSASQEIHIIDSPPSRELLISLAGVAIDALILVDHAPFATTVLTNDIDPTEIRGEALRAVFALELARRAGRTLVLSEDDAQSWGTALATLWATPASADFSGPCPPRTGSGAMTDSPLLLTYLRPLFAASAGKPPLVLTWPRESFLDGDAPGQILPAIVEVAGRARILAYGPYLPLPAGSWRATAFLGFTPDIGKLPFILEADTGGSVDRGFFEVVNGGIFSLELDFHVDDPLHLVELRLISQDSSLEGQLSLIAVDLERLPA